MIKIQRGFCTGFLPGKINVSVSGSICRTGGRDPPADEAAGDDFTSQPILGWKAPARRSARRSASCLMQGTGHSC